MDTSRSGRAGIRTLRGLAGFATLHALALSSTAASAQHTGMTLDSGEAATSAPLRWGWMLLGTYMLAGLVSAALCCHMAYSRKLSPAFWFGAGLAANLLALAVIVTRPRDGNMPPGLARAPDTSTPAPCPGCGAFNHPAASGCLECGATLAAAYEPEKLRAVR